jgi:4-diphosphocytidyl-2-C-methyl-D-erythritol kinase
MIDFEAQVGATATFKAPAKLNLRLKVTGRQADGYHLLSMLNVTTSLCDEITLTYTLGDRVITECEGVTEPNLAAKAAQEFFSRAKIPLGAAINIKKRIPVGGGLGGGSSDAAAVLKELARRFGSYPFVPTLAKSLGADVPYFLHGGIALVEGIGERITPIVCSEIEEWPCLLINPGFSVNTKEAFKELNWKEEIKENPLRFKDPVSAQQLFELIENDFFPIYGKKYPEFTDAVLSLKEAQNVYIGLSGSGSTMFVIPAEKQMNLLKISQFLKEKIPGNYFEFICKLCHSSSK